MESSPIKPLKGMISTKYAYVGFEKYVHTVLKVHELNSTHSNLESVPFSKLQYWWKDIDESIHWETSF